ncbi:MAG: hypothetical protein H7321_01560 [Bacteroidia bacterium]|nr:hypothetical protein [Bacteroidia bacterium]
MKHKIILFISILPLLLPLNQIFETLQLQSFMVITPVFIFIIYLTWLWLSIKNNNPKSEIKSINNFRNQYLFNNQ